MAYLEKVACNDAVSAWSTFIRFVCGDSSTPGKDWVIVLRELDESTDNNVQQIPYSGTITVNALDTYIWLPSISVYDYAFTKNGNTLQEGVDYVVDTALGRVRFVSGGAVQQGDVVNYSYLFKRDRFYLYNTGIAGQDEIYLSFAFFMRSLDNESHIAFNAHEKVIGNVPVGSDWSILAPFTQEDVFYGVALWNNPVYLWVFSNKQRIILVVASESFYSFGYAGFVNRFAMPTEYYKPMVVSASHRFDKNYDSWEDLKLHDSEDDDVRNFIMQGYRYMDEGGTWHGKDFTSTGCIHPYLKDRGSSLLDINYPDGFPESYFPILLTPEEDLFVGYYDGILWCPSSSLTSESVVQDGNGNEYIVFPDVYRNSFYGWIAIKKE